MHVIVHSISSSGKFPYAASNYLLYVTPPAKCAVLCFVQLKREEHLSHAIAGRDLKGGSQLRMASELRTNASYHEASNNALRRKTPRGRTIRQTGLSTSCRVFDKSC